MFLLQADCIVLLININIQIKISFLKKIDERISITLLFKETDIFKKA